MISESPESVVEMISRNDSTYLQCAAGWPRESGWQLRCRIGVQFAGSYVYLGKLWAPGCGSALNRRGIAKN